MPDVASFGAEDCWPSGDEAFSVAFGFRACHFLMLWSTEDGNESQVCAHPSIVCMSLTCSAPSVLRSSPIASATLDEFRRADELSEMVPARSSIQVARHPARRSFAQQ
jgi:hypothetical protein